MDTREDGLMSVHNVKNSRCISSLRLCQSFVYQHKQTPLRVSVVGILVLCVFLCYV